MCFGTCTCVILQLLTPQLHSTVCYSENCCFHCLLHPPMQKFIEKNIITCCFGLIDTRVIALGCIVANGIS